MRSARLVATFCRRKSGCSGAPSAACAALTHVRQRPFDERVEIAAGVALLHRRGDEVLPLRRLRRQDDLVDPIPGPLVVHDGARAELRDGEEPRARNETRSVPLCPTVPGCMPRAADGESCSPAGTLRWQDTDSCRSPTPCCGWHRSAVRAVPQPRRETASLSVGRRRTVNDPR